MNTTTSIGIKNWAGNLTITKVWETGLGDDELIGWMRSDGLRAIETNGDPLFEAEAGFDAFWNHESGESVW